MAALLSQNVSQTSFNHFPSNEYDSDETPKHAFISFANPLQTLSLPPLQNISRFNEETGFWSQQSFNEGLQLPPVKISNPNPDPEDEPANPLPKQYTNSMFLTFEAQAAGGIILALSPSPEFRINKTYALTFGSSGNLKCSIKRRTDGSITENDGVEVPGRCCHANSWVKYWVHLKGGKLSIGVNEDCEGGSESTDDDMSEESTSSKLRNCLLQYDDSAYDSLRPSQDRVKFIGLGNLVAKQKGQNGRGQTQSQVKIRNLYVRYANEEDVVPVVRAHNLGVFSVKHKTVAGGEGGYQADLDAVLLQEWSAEIERMRKRAEKFGSEFKIPGVESFLKWSEAKRLRANPQQGFITGIDTESAAEEEKKRLRNERFERDRKREANRKRGRNDDSDVEEEEKPVEKEAGAEGDDMATEDNAIGERPYGVKLDLPPHNAYANEKFANKWRVDPKISFENDEGK